MATALCQAGRWSALLQGIGEAGKVYQETGSWKAAGIALGLGILGFLTGGCFVAGTQVIVGIDPNDPTKYITRNIENIQVGDLVLSRDANDPDAPLVWKPVMETYRQSVQSIKIITVLHEDGTTENIRTTDQHPFWVEYADGGGMWVEARLLTAGMTLVDEDGNTVVVTGIVDQRLASGVTVYNFEVEDTHSYFVADALGNAVWVHNGRPCRLYDGPIHHIATDKGKIAVRFATLFARAGVSLQSPWNRMRLAGHVGPHGRFVNELIYNRLESAISGKTGPALRVALIEELKSLRWDIRHTDFGDLFKASASWIDNMGRF